MGVKIKNSPHESSIVDGDVRTHVGEEGGDGVGSCEEGARVSILSLHEALKSFFDSLLRDVLARNDAAGLYDVDWYCSQSLTVPGRCSRSG